MEMTQVRQFLLPVSAPEHHWPVGAAYIITGLATKTGYVHYPIIHITNVFNLLFDKTSLPLSKAFNFQFPI
ncbi:hypothetical protein DSUL_100053 [Desulfovibrionales bacterium]